MGELIVGEAEGFLKRQQAAYWAIPCANSARLSWITTRRADPETVTFRLLNKANASGKEYRKGRFRLLD
ncbi:hypothetical protein [Paraburkholderia sp. BL27I4N3]|uniref:hypothetical protein n=1 Tax=Paraburkholderia sp. BL27I4N3 TaxID=1938805 RepID=UPI0011C076E0|nr:hypothetical protein [Paraburkholderia sp. BL27I4N3]